MTERWSSTITTTSSQTKWTLSGEYGECFHCCEKLRIIGMPGVLSHRVVTLRFGLSGQLQLTPHAEGCQAIAGSP